MSSSSNGAADTFFRSMVAARCGGAEFDQGGSYVFSQMLAAERELAKNAVPGDPSTAVLAFSVADPVLKMDRGAMDAACEYYNVSPDATRYTDLAGIRNIEVKGQMCANTQEALALLVNRGTELTADNIQYSPGAIKKALSTYIPKTFFDSDTVLIMPDPSYGVIASEINRESAEVVTVSLFEDEEGYGLDLESLKDIRHKDSIFANKKVVMYVNIPHNPTGFGYCENQWTKLLKFAKENQILLIIDEAYVDIAYDDELVSVIEVEGWQDCCVVIQSISKAYNATGIRFGWLLAHPTAIKALRKVMDSQDSGSPAPMIASALYCLENKYLAEETQSYYEALHKQLSDILGLCGFATVPPEAGLCQLSGFPEQASDGTKFAKPSEFANWLRENHLVSVMPQDAIGKIRWAATFRPQPEYGLETETYVLNELARRLKSAIG